MLELRPYQQRSLDILRDYLKLASSTGADHAFVDITGRGYKGVEKLPDLPYVCLRVPTGGGKTLMAAHSLGIVARELLHAEHPVCLWLVPTNVIREQTLKALRDRKHPYREALASYFSGFVNIMDLSQALAIQQSTLDGETCVIVSTLAALRVEDTEGRKVYESADSLQHHFEDLGPKEEWLERRVDGSIPYSLANVLRMRRPVVIMDEAHNARTTLSFETLSRFWPSCIVEFTATPETTHKPSSGFYASNILHHVSALELKEDQMVKLPIRLRTRPDWKEIIADAVQTQRGLEKKAVEEEKETGEYIRPIVLLQAQSKSQTRETLTVEVVKKTLLEDFRIPEEQVAVATGETKEIDGLDLFDPKCQVRYIITVQALREGWDCSFAYVLCSVSEVATARSVEQILGRVLRMPRARTKRNPELNCAYALAASGQFIETAEALKDALVENGFQKMEASALVVSDEEAQRNLFGPGTLWETTADTITERVPEKPNLETLDAAMKNRISFNEEASTLTVSGTISDQDSDALQKCFKQPAAKHIIRRMHQVSQERAARAASPSAQGKPFRVPMMAIRVDGQLELFEETHLLAEPWDLADRDANLSETEFPSKVAAGKVGEIDVSEKGKAGWQFVEELHEQLATLIPEVGWTVPALVTWLDQQIPVPLRHEFTHAQSSLYINRVVTGLLEARKLTVEQLARQKFRLRNAVVEKIASLRSAQMRHTFQRLLFDPGTADIEVDPAVYFSYTAEHYAPNRYDDSGYRWRKHFFHYVAEFDTKEEYECAIFIDSMLKETRYWVRNLPNRAGSFSLQTSTDRFYPDFVVLLEDERILVVEYKGEDRWSNDDSKEKRAVGNLWAARSKGRCLFVMPKGKDWDAIVQKIAEKR